MFFYIIRKLTLNNILGMDRDNINFIIKIF